jgi:hypothetical protein
MELIKIKQLRYIEIFALSVTFIGFLISLFIFNIDESFVILLSILALAMMLIFKLQYCIKHNLRIMSKNFLMYHWIPIDSIFLVLVFCFVFIKDLMDNVYNYSCLILAIVCLAITIVEMIVCKKCLKKY